MDWLYKEDEYKPKTDKDAFVHKSILSVFGLLGRIQKSQSHDRGIIYKIHPLIKLISALIMILLTALTRDLVFIMALWGYSLFLLILVNREDRNHIIYLTAFLPLFTLIVLIPSMLSGNVRNSTIIVVKVALSILNINIMSHTTSWHGITSALKIMGIPDIFIFVMDIAIRYIYALGEAALDMLYGLKVKLIGRSKNKIKLMTSLIGSLFLKSSVMGNEMYSAMTCRGFLGEYKSKLIFDFNKYDYIYFAPAIIMIAVYFIL